MPEFIKFVRVRGKAGQIPMKAYQDDAGFDLQAAESGNIAPGEVRTFGIGIVAHFPEQFCGIIIGRSSLWHKRGLLLLPPVSVIDSGYRGELTVTLHWPMFPSLGASGYDFARHGPVATVQDIHEGDRLAQVLLIPVPRAEFLEQADLPTSKRGDNGYGSSGR